MSNKTSGIETNRLNDYIVGGTYIGSSIIYILSYIPSLIVIYRDKTLYNKSCYKIMMAMGISDIIQLFFVGIVSGGYTIAASTYNFLTNKITGGILNATWICTTVMATVLAVDRFLDTKYYHIHVHLFDGNKPWYWILGCVVYASLWLIAYMTPNLEVIYFLDQYTWNYNEVYKPSKDCWFTELFNDITTTFIMVVCNVAIAVQIRQTRHIPESMRISTDDRKALLQAFIMCLLIAIYVAIWFGMGLLTTNVWAMMSMNVIWILMAGTNGILYPFFVPSVRRQYVDMFWSVFSCGTRNKKPQKKISVVNNRARSMESGLSSMISQWQAPNAPRRKTGATVSIVSTTIDFRRPSMVKTQGGQWSKDKEPLEEVNGTNGASNGQMEPIGTIEDDDRLALISDEDNVMPRNGNYQQLFRNGLGSGTEPGSVPDKTEPKEATAATRQEVMTKTDDVIMRQQPIRSLQATTADDSVDKRRSIAVASEADNTSFDEPTVEEEGQKPTQLGPKPNGISANTGAINADNSNDRPKPAPRGLFKATLRKLGALNWLRNPNTQNAINPEVLYPATVKNAAAPASPIPV